MEIRRCRYIGIIIILVGLCVLVTGQRQNISRRRMQSMRQNNLIRSRQNGGGQQLRGSSNFNRRNNNARVQQRNRLQQSRNQNQQSLNRLQQPRNILRTRLQNNQRQSVRQLQRPALQNSNRIQNSNSFTTLQPVLSTRRNMQQRTGRQNSFQVTTLQPIFSTRPNVQNYTTINGSNTIKVSEGDVAVKGSQQHGLKLHRIQQQQLLQSQEQYPQLQEHSQIGGMQQFPEHLNGHHMSGMQQQLQPQEYYLRESTQQQLLLPRQHYQESQHHQVLVPQEYSSQESRHQQHMQLQDNRLHGYRQLYLVRQTEHHPQLQSQEHYPQEGQHQQQLQPELQPHHQRKMEYSSLSQQRQLNQQKQQDQGKWGLRHGDTQQQKLPEQQHQQLPEQRQGHGQRQGQEQQQQHYQVSQQNENIQQHQSLEPKQEPQQRSLLQQRQSQMGQLDQRIQRPHNLQEKQKEQKHSRQQFSDLKPNPPKQQEGRSTQNDHVLDNGSYTQSRSPVKNTHSSFGHTDNTNQAIHGNEPLHGLSNSVPQGLLPEYLDRRGNMGASHRYRAVLESNEGSTMRSEVAVDSNLSPVEMPREIGLDSGHRNPLILHPSSKKMLNIPNPEIGIQSQSNHRSDNLQRQERVRNEGGYPIPPTGNAARGSVDSQMPSWSGSFSDIDHRRHEMQPQGNVVDRKNNFNTEYQNINAGGQVLQVQESKYAPYPNPYKDNQKSGNKIYTSTQFYPDQINSHGRLQYEQAAVESSHSSRAHEEHRGNMIPDPLPSQMEVNPIYVHGNDVSPGRKELAPARSERNTSLDRPPTRRRVLDLQTDMNRGNRNAGSYNHHDSTHPIIEHNIDSTSIDRGKTQNSGKPITANVNRRITIVQPGTNVYATNQAVLPSLAEASTTHTGAYEGSNHNASSLAYRHFDHVQERHSQQHQRHLHHRQQPEQHHQHTHQVQGQQDQQQSLRQQIKEQQPNPLKHHERTRAQTDIPLNNEPILRSGVQMLSLENQNNFHSSMSNNANKAISGSEPLTTNSNSTAPGRRLEHLDRLSSMGASYTHHNMLETNQGLAIESQSLTKNVMAHGQHTHDPNYAPNSGSYTDNRRPENAQYTLNRPGQQGTGAFAPRQNESSQISQSQTSLNNTATTSSKYDTQANDRTQLNDRNGPWQLGSSIGYHTGSDVIMDTVRQETVGQWQDSTTGLSQSKDFGQPLHEPYSQHQPSSLNQHLIFDQPHQGKHYPDTTGIDSHGSLPGRHQSEYYTGNEFPAPIEYPPQNQYLDAHQYPPTPESALPSSNQYPLPSNQHSQSSNHYPLASDQFPLVSDQYPLVSDQYSPLSNQYAQQSNQHAPSPNQYVPSSNRHLSPSDQYPPLPDQHSPLSNQYAPPPNQHVPDSNQYPSPSNEHLPPSNQYDPPLDQPNQYLPPSNQNAAQSNQYPPPSNQDLPPPIQYVAPPNQYVPPIGQLNQYAPPSNQNAAQPNLYQPPSTHHLPQSDQYAPPQDHYSPPYNQYAPPPDQYPPPPNQYPLPPSQ